MDWYFLTLVLPIGLLVWAIVIGSVALIAALVMDKM